jgi:hypothetical protein
MGICDKCGERLIEIDFYSERLTGCVECRRDAQATRIAFWN